MPRSRSGEAPMPGVEKLSVHSCCFGLDLAAVRYEDSMTRKDLEVNGLDVRWQSP